MLLKTVERFFPSRTWQAEECDGENFNSWENGFSLLAEFRSAATEHVRRLKRALGRYGAILPALAWQVERNCADVWRGWSGQRLLPEGDVVTPHSQFAGPVLVLGVHLCMGAF
jgi:hypothetical protein